MNEEEAAKDYRLNGIVAYVNWNACETCRYYPSELGGCEIGAPDDILNFEFDEFGGDTLLCRKWEPKTLKPKRDPRAGKEAVERMSMTEAEKATYRERFGIVSKSARETAESATMPMTVKSDKTLRSAAGLTSASNRADTSSAEAEMPKNSGGGSSPAGTPSETPPNNTTGTGFPPTLSTATAVANGVTILSARTVATKYGPKAVLIAAGGAEYWGSPFITRQIAEGKASFPAKVVSYVSTKYDATGYKLIPSPGA